MPTIPTVNALRQPGTLPVTPPEGVPLARSRSDIVSEVESLRHRLVYDAPVEQAIGIVMGARRCCPDQARQMLAEVADHCHVSVHELAVLLVCETVGGLSIDFDRWKQPHRKASAAD